MRLSDLIVRQGTERILVRSFDPAIVALALTICRQCKDCGYGERLAFGWVEVRSASTLCSERVTYRTRRYNIAAAVFFVSHAFYDVGRRKADCCALSRSHTRSSRFPRTPVPTTAGTASLIYLHAFRNILLKLTRPSRWSESRWHISKYRP